MPDRDVLTKLQTYGILRDNFVERHKFKGTEINNGVRTMTFKCPTKDIPTILFMNGNRILVKYPSQDRTPICSICKEIAFPHRVPNFESEGGHYTSTRSKFVRGGGRVHLKIPT